MEKYELWPLSQGGRWQWKMAVLKAGILSKNKFLALNSFTRMFIKIATYLHSIIIHP